MGTPLLGDILTSDESGGDLQTTAKLNRGCSGAGKGRLEVVVMYRECKQRGASDYK